MLAADRVKILRSQVRLDKSSKLLHSAAAREHCIRMIAAAGRYPRSAVSGGKRSTPGVGTSANENEQGKGSAKGERAGGRRRRSPAPFACCWGCQNASPSAAETLVHRRRYHPASVNTVMIAGGGSAIWPLARLWVADARTPPGQWRASLTWRRHQSPRPRPFRRHRRTALTAGAGRPGVVGGRRTANFDTATFLSARWCCCSALRVCLCK